VEVGEHIAALAQEGGRLAEAAERGGLDARTPSCPDWQIRDLLRHIGGVHRWAASYVTTGNPRPSTDDEDRAFFAPPPDGQLIDWFRYGHASLVNALRTAGPNLSAWSFLPAPSALAFWARRQAHETAIHRVDAEVASGAAMPFAPRFAVDGIDELLCGLLSRRRGPLVSDPPLRLGLRATDARNAWTVRIGPDRCVTRLGLTEADCTVACSASDLYLLLWNRRDRNGLDIQGDESILELWRAKATVTWS
jgi:uncharacterized protein (TIGR03083 family)